MCVTCLLCLVFFFLFYPVIFRLCLSFSSHVVNYFTHLFSRLVCVYKHWVFLFLLVLSHFWISVVFPCYLIVYLSRVDESRNYRPGSGGEHFRCNTRPVPGIHGSRNNIQPVDSKNGVITKPSPSGAVATRAILTFLLSALEEGNQSPHTANQPRGRKLAPFLETLILNK